MVRQKIEMGFKCVRAQCASPKLTGTSQSAAEKKPPPPPGLRIRQPKVTDQKSATVAPMPREELNWEPSQYLRVIPELFAFCEKLGDEVGPATIRTSG